MSQSEKGTPSSTISSLGSPQLRQPISLFDSPSLSESQNSGSTVVDGKQRVGVKEEAPLLSILNVVVDHCMAPPSPLEPAEYRQARIAKSKAQEQAKSLPSPTIEVPILRVFGPVVRGGCEKPHQSACLYIHNAFPYLLARPVIAGPDGSLHRSSHLPSGKQRSSQGAPIDWDDVDSVTAHIAGIHKALEDAIQASMFGGFDNNTSNNKSPSSGEIRQTTRVIRRISVVVGRGFYTFCPGPAAPFLRVEYYDPKLRWKVKFVLERGLDLPRSYHPDPQQYCATLSKPAFAANAELFETGEEEIEDHPTTEQEMLRFHCYEAHIPYTMQFFKDFNIAGMAYIHLSKVYFRGLPRKHIRAKVDDEEQVFLQHNTTAEHLWSSHEYEDNEEEMLSQEDTMVLPPAYDDKQQHPRTHLSLARLEPHWNRKGTSCDLEMDVSAESILNVNDIMTPGEVEEEQEQQHETVHWRTVPSLKEIWREERRRMKKLLLPEDDFLSAKPMTPPPSDLTLNVRNAASRSGTKLAVLGMQRLVRVTHGLADEFHRTMSQIVKRHLVSILRIDQALKERKEKEQLKATEEATEEAINALAAMAEHLDNSPSNNSQSSQSNSQAFSLNSDASTAELLRLSQISASSLHEEASEIEELSQRIDRGESVVDHDINHTEDFLDPGTLMPYEGDDDEDGDLLGEADMTEGEMEKSLTVLATQTTRGTEGRSIAKRSTIPLPFQNDSVTEASPFGDDEGEEYASDDNVESMLDFNVSSTHDSSDQRSSCIIEAPSRREVQKSNSPLLPIHTKNSCPSWLPLTAQYNKTRKPNSESLTRAFNETGTKVYCTPTVGPPTRQVVEKWLNKDSVAGKPTGDSTTSLEIDGNSRQLVVVRRGRSRKKRRIEICNSNATMDANEVEEVIWEASQSVELSQAHLVNNAETSDNPQSGFRPVVQSSESQGTTSSMSGSQEAQPLEGIGQQGGRIHIEGGGGLKARTKTTQTQTDTSSSPKVPGTKDLPKPLTIMVVEIHVQCRSGRAGVGDSREIAMRPNFTKDLISAITFISARDPGGGRSIEVLERGCLFVPVGVELSQEGMKGLASLASGMKSALPKHSFGVRAPLTVEVLSDEQHLLLRLASIVRWKDPDMLLSWDPQGSGLGFIIERGHAIGNPQHGLPTSPGPKPAAIDMSRLLGRTPTAKNASGFNDKLLPKEFDESKENDGGKSTEEALFNGPKWAGSGLGADWDERVGAGAAAASIVGRIVFSGWKLVAEEVKHPNASYFPAIVSTILNRRIPFHDDLRLTHWYGADNGRERWRVLHHRLEQGMALVMIFDKLDIIGRAGEASRLSGVEFSQSFPGIRGSQYKVEGVLLRALKSVHSDDRGAKRGRNKLHNGSSSIDGKFTAIDPTSKSLTNESKSQSQSPWKTRKGLTKMGEDHVHNVSERCYFFYSPSVRDTSNQEALECQALTLEPQSSHQQDPVIVCDFTALYPSLVIAYNLCYSTCAGRLSYHTTRREMRHEGRTTGKLGPFQYPESRTATVLHHHMKSIDPDFAEGSPEDVSHDRAYSVPTGTIFVSESVLKGVLPQVLDELLSTRAMLKKAAKLYKKHVKDLSPAVLRQLEARQLALKYVANVTYGYTSATFSGRCAMPLLADSIVECARRTLTNAINMANSWGADRSGRWFGAQVLYGDTDSLFVKLPGRSVAEAFDFGEQLCKAVTASNPPPVQLKLEKVYLGSILQTKKKYCGMKFESRDQKKPVFEAKGIETVRRDQCALTQKILRNVLVTLFHTSDLDAVKAYLFRQWNLILAGQLPVSDFILTGRVRSKYRGGRIGPVQAALARRLAEADPGRIVRHKERLAYVIVATPGLTFKLRNCVLTPMELLEQWDSYNIHAVYYITKHVNAAVQRCLGLAPHHVDISAWFNECPKPKRRIHFWPASRSGNSLMISAYFGSDICSLCGAKCKAQGSSRAVVCNACRFMDSAKAVTQTMAFRKKIARDAHAIAMECSSCNGCFEDAHTFAMIKETEKERKTIMRLFGGNDAGVVTPLANCTCIDCPNTFERHRLREAGIESEAICRVMDLL